MIERIKLTGFVVLAIVLGGGLWILAAAWGWHVDGWLLVGMIRQYPQHSTLPLTLANFLAQHPHIDLNELYKRGSWLELVAKSKDEVKESGADEGTFKKPKYA